MNTITVITIIILIIVLFGGKFLSQYISKPGLKATFSNYDFYRYVNNYFIEKWITPKTQAEFIKNVKNFCNAKSLKQEAIDALGLDESELIEIEPIFFENFYLDLDKIEEQANVNSSGFLTKLAYAKDYFWKIDNNVLQTSKYQVTWLFCTQKQVCIYEKTFNLVKDETDTLTQQYLWKHITSIAAVTNKVKNQKCDYLEIGVTGDKYTCVMERNDDTNKAIQAIKRKLVEFA